MSLDDARGAWSRRHGGLDPDSSVWVRGWLRIVHAAAVPLARRGVSPDLLTGLGVVVSAVVPGLAALGGAWPLLAAAAVVGAALVDGVDGAVAELEGGGSAWGEVLDPLADRLSDLLLLAALALLGAPGWLVVVVAAVTLLHESLRSSARVAGMAGVGAVTVWERPSRVIVAAFGVGLCGLLPGVDDAVVATAAVSIAAALAAAGFAHLLLACRRALRP